MKAIFRRVVSPRGTNGGVDAPDDWRSTCGRQADTSKRSSYSRIPFPYTLAR